MSVYPGSIDSFNNPAGTSVLTSPDHALQHSNANDAIMAVETVLGATNGTNVLKDFSAGNFPARVNSGGTIVQVLTGGTINASTIGTPSITGGTAQNALIGTSQITGGTAQGYQSKYHTLGSATITGTASTTHNLDLNTATRFLINMPNSAGSLTLTTSNVSPNQPFLVEVLQGTAGLGTVNFFGTVSWLNNGTTAPTQGTTASRKASYFFISTGTSTFDGYLVGKGE